MRYMIMVCATFEAGAGPVPHAPFAAEMAACVDSLSRAGVLLDAAALRPSAEGFRLHGDAGHRRLIDGPFTDRPAMIATYAVIQARDRAEAMEWARRFPAPTGPRTDAFIEVRPLRDPDDASTD